ncbi:ABC transporter substrate-binding protein, partial [Mycobacteroides abscessus subsp. massiliense]|nr:ABC transporter substrate-binding protein [Mycobacteroides abscessus subsp. massiliense]
MKRTALLAAILIVLATGCSLDSGSGSSHEVSVVVGYQSKTINTVTAGTLLR